MLGRTVELQPKTHKGKIRIQDHGKSWLVVRVQDSVQFSSERGTWLFVAPLNTGVANSRWVNFQNDKDFIVQ